MTGRIPLPPIVKAAAGLFALGLGAFFYAWRVEPALLEVRRLRINLRAWPKGLDGFRIGQISDLHVGELSRRETLERAIAEVNREKPDLVAITGDILDVGDELDGALALLGKLAVRPAYLIPGNHEYKAGESYARQFFRRVEALGITVLSNSHAAYEWDESPESKLWVVGVDDASLERDDLARAITGLPDDGCSRLLLSHTPDILFELRPREFSLALSGHTHGGQLYVPFLTERMLRTSYSRLSHGLYYHRGIPCYVSRGVGALGLPLRFLRRPEITIFTLECDNIPR